ncbi:MAG: DUF3619 family protein [Burkholderiaceae bacterium]|jgi:hypothetical protein|nr:DUF3619 family protein [Burkholderiaceae bacterium]
MKTTTIPLAEIRQHRLGLRIAARLAAGAVDLPRDVQERLRAAREQALASRKCPVSVTVTQDAGQAAVLGQAGGAAVLGGFGGWGSFNGLRHWGAGKGLDGNGAGWWSGLISVAVALALAAGLVAIDGVQDDQHTTDVANVDTALLTDDLPPQAYADPGFAQFLKTDAPSAAVARD